MHTSPDLPVPQILVAMLGYSHNIFPTPLQTLVLVESVTSVEQAMKVLELITRHLANRADMDANDCEPRIAHSPRPHQTPILTPPPCPTPIRAPPQAVLHAALRDHHQNGPARGRARPLWQPAALPGPWSRSRPLMSYQNGCFDVQLH